MQSTDEAVIKLLRSLPDERPSWIPPEHRVIRRHRVIGSGGDPAAVEAWVKKVGGGVVRVPEPISGGTMTWRPKDHEDAFMVPLGALVDHE